MAYTTAEGRQELLDSLAEAIDELGFALAALAAAYEQLDVMTADELEEKLFGPLQRSYGRAQRIYGAFAERAGLETGGFSPHEAGPPSAGPKRFIENAAHAVSSAGGMLATLQDSPKLLDVGDAELRQGLTALRTTIDPLPRTARELTRRLGR